MNSSTIEFYKIRRSDGFFSGGGIWPKFSKRGKSWLRHSDLIRHLGEVSPQSKAYENCQIVSFKYELKSAEENSISDVLADLDRRRAEKLEAKIAARQAREEREERREYDRLRAKFESFRGDPDT